MTRTAIALVAHGMLLVACGGHAATGPDGALHPDGSIPDDAAITPDAQVPDGQVPTDAAVEPGPPGYIGSPCATVADCTYEGAVCLLPGDGFPGGTCSLPCDQYCPDQEGFPTTFCVAGSALPPAGAALGDGACLSRCDFGIFPGTGCRPGYGCVAEPRANDPDTLVSTCMPGEETVLTPCQADLVARGVAFEPTFVPDESPADHPTLTCHVEDPVYLLSPVHGVALRSSGGSETPKVLAACALAHAITSTIDDVAPRGAIALRHLGTYSCRVVAGTDSLSRHAFGDAIDIAGFDLDDGSLYTVVNDWEHDTESPQTPGGIFLYEAAHRWFDAYVWNTVLTPNYNAAHDDHLHVDLTPAAHFLQLWSGRYLGPAPYAD
jgi:hypothetical protein